MRKMKSTTLFTSAMKTIIILLIFLFAAVMPLFGQVSINSDGSTPDPSAMLEVKSTAKGMLVPRLTSAERTAILNPAPGLLVYDTTTRSFWFYKTGGWTELPGGGGSSATSIHDADNDTKVLTEKNADEDKIRFNLAGTERMVLYPNRLDLLHPNDNLFIGINSGWNTTGFHNTGFGLNLLTSNTTGSENSGMGHGCLFYNTGDYNVAFGSQALYYNISGNENTALGYSALNLNFTGSYNTGIGSYVLNINYYGNRNTAVGEGALQGTQGANNTVAGFSAGGGAASGNVFLGFLAGNQEYGSNKLYIDNLNSSAPPLIWGDFTTRVLTFNGKLGVGTPDPLNKLHIAAYSDPLRLEGLQTSSGLTFLVVDGNGVVSKRPDCGPAIQDAAGNTKIQTEKYPDEDIIRFDLDGTEKMVLQNDRLTVADKLGIRTTNPQNQLDIVSSANPLRLEGLQVTSNSYFLVADNNGVISKRPEGGVGTCWELEGNTGLSSVTNFIGTNNNTPLNFRVNNVTAGSIDPDRRNTSYGNRSLFSNLAGNSNVAIGNNAGYAETGSNRLYIDNQVRGSLQDGRDKSLVYGLFDADPANQKLALNANVGIGTSAPQNKLHILSTSDPLRMEGLQTTTNTDVLVVENNGVVSRRPRSFIPNWFLTGNSGTDPGLNFIGTNDSISFIMKVNNMKSGIIDVDRKNTAYGYQSLFSDVSGMTNSAIGSKALFSNTSGNDNSAFGSNALGHNTTGYSNVAIGAGALCMNITLNNLVAIGDSALFNNGTGAGLIDHGARNTAVGSKAMMTNSTGYDNAASGFQAMFANNTGWGNTASGAQALAHNTSGHENTANGYRSLFNNTEGFCNSAFGCCSMNDNEHGSNNTSIGYYSLQTNINGNGNTAIGTVAFRNNNYADNNTVIGMNAGLHEGTGNNNTLIGYSANVASEGISNATAIGRSAVANYSNTVVLGNNEVSRFYCMGAFASTAGILPNLYVTADGQIIRSTSGGASWLLSGNGGTNTATNFLGTTDSVSFVVKVNNKSSGIIDVKRKNTGFGYKTLFSLTTGGFNTAFGTNALYWNNANWRSTAIGYGAMYYADSRLAGRDTYNTAVGYEALCGSTTASDNSGQYNTATGYQALYSNTSGHDNTATGYQSLLHNSSGSENTALGYHALASNEYGSRSTAIGSHALEITDLEGENVAVGALVLYANYDGFSNAAFGNGALYNNNGNCNIAIGVNALNTNTSGSGNTALGTFTKVANSNQVNSTVIGYSGSVPAGNRALIGNTSVTSIGGWADWTNWSDKRFKKDLASNVPGLGFIMKLQPVTYHMDVESLAAFMHTPDSLRLRDAEAKKAGMLQSGFVAQEVEQAANEIEYDFSGIDKPENEKCSYGLRYAEFTIPLVKTLQEQQIMIAKQKARIGSLKRQINEMKERVGKK
jgi:trimeric autotransporter adhesin